MKLFYLILFALFLGASCSDDPDTNGADVGDPGDTDQVNANGGADAGDAGEPGDAGHGDTDAPNGGEEDPHCPNVVLPSETSVTYEGSTIGKDNLFESNRLEWGEAGDDALLYVVPETGSYEFFMSEGASEVQGCGVSIYNRIDDETVYFTPDICPEEGQVAQLPEAYYVAGEGFGDIEELTQGQELLILVSCAFWATPSTEADYSLSIQLQ